jgi:hypothetical protein
MVEYYAVNVEEGVHRSSKTNGDQKIKAGVAYWFL